MPAAAEVVIIGGGVIGVSCAYHLVAAGVDGVVLVERGTLGSGSTSKAAGGIRASFSNRCNIEMGLHSLAAYARFSARFGQDIDFRRHGYLYLLSNELDVSKFEAVVSLHNEFGVRSELIDPTQAQRLSPLIATDGLAAAVWSPDDARATPESVLLGYAAAARQLGAVLRTGVRVVEIETSDRRIVAVHTDAGTIHTGGIVCAAGAWSAQVGDMVGVVLPVVPIRRQVVFVRPAEPLPKLPCITAELPSTFYYHPEGPGLAMGFSDRTETPGFDVDYEPERLLPALFALVERRAPILVDVGIAGGWAGLYEVTPDDNEIIGESEEVSRFLYATGFSGHGFMMAPAVGEIIRDLYLGRAPLVDISDCDVRRFTRPGAAGREQVII
jgi:glycine/D-amino acid oxidase-like deaminating enzyme